MTNKNDSTGGGFSAAVPTHELHSFRILDRAAQMHTPSLIVPSVSGGYDSLAMLSIVARWHARRALTAPLVALSADTMLSADGWREYVAAAVAQVAPRAEHEIVKTPSFDKFAESVKTFGLPYTPAAHKGTFGLLKRDAFRLFLRENKTHWHDRIMFVTGVRRAESRARADTAEITRHGASVYANCIAHWSLEDITRYRYDYDVPPNPFYDIYGNSGDCECNWTTNVSLETVACHAPKLHATVKELDKISRHYHGHGYGERGDCKNVAGGNAPEQLALFDDMPNLCHGCERKPYTQNEIDAAIMRLMEW